ncbi:YkgJ family cysteine cluster protein [Citreimonas salinaria]|uniref:Putative zinc-or iron-chelating domain-containing protein n=1 Tax=Citreimonas salinaria TaxID=321339 RepID=A0A1H3F8X9_9RHOB|nr:YkgJ family cysteine cluster protein [Citreimonas salinaria]SDX86664.1 Putative zinc-or iron-chelating domain-containing protein [Citreimonas salinaria]
MSQARGDLRNRLAKARTQAAAGAADRARRGLTAFAEASAARGVSTTEIVAALADGTAAVQLGRVGLSGAPFPAGLDCARGCAFCCILGGADGGTITEAEARALHAALAPLAGRPDGRDWHPDACAALDPETRACRAYDARPMICRSYVSTDVSACESVAGGTAKPGPGTLGPYHDYLAAIGLGRAALKGTRRVTTYALARVAAAAVEGRSPDDTLSEARHKPSELDAELKRSRRDAGGARPAGLP